MTVNESRDSTTGVITVTWTIDDNNSLTTSSTVSITLIADPEVDGYTYAGFRKERIINYTNKCQTTSFISAISDPLVTMVFNAPTTAT